MIGALHVLCTELFKRFFPPVHTENAHMRLEQVQLDIRAVNCYIVRMGWWDMYEFTASNSRPGWHDHVGEATHSRTEFKCTLWLRKEGWQFGFNDATILHVIPLGRPLHLNRAGLCCFFLVQFTCSSVQCNFSLFISPEVVQLDHIVHLCQVNRCGHFCGLHLEC